jgi:hypothetical protein
MHPDGTDLHPLHPSVGDEYNPSWSPDGSRLLIWKKTGIQRIDLIPDVVTELQSVSLDGADTLVLVSDVMGWSMLPDADWCPAAP